MDLLKVEMAMAMELELKYAEVFYVFIHLSLSLRGPLYVCLTVVTATIPPLKTTYNIHTCYLLYY